MKLKINEKLVKKMFATASASIILLSGFSGCSKKNNSKNEYVASTSSSISSTFPSLNDDLVLNSSLMIRLYDLTYKDSEGKTNIDELAKYKARIDADNMISDFNSFLDTLEQAMLDQQNMISISSICDKDDTIILSKIELLTSNIIEASKSNNKNEVVSNFDTLYKLFVLEDKVNFDGLEFEVRDLSYTSRAIASAYARVGANFASKFVAKDKLEKIDKRTNNQNNKAYIKETLSIAQEKMEEKSEIDVVSSINEKYDLAGSIIKVNSNVQNNKNLVNYINLRYLVSDKVSYKDFREIVEDYNENDVNNTILLIDSIGQYNANNSNNIIVLSNLLLDNYKETKSGKVDAIALDFVQFNTIKLSKDIESGKIKTMSDLEINPYYKNLFKYTTKQNFVHKVNGESKTIVWQEISDNVNFVNYELINYTFNKLSDIKELSTVLDKSNTNLLESIQSLQNTIMGECKKIDSGEYVKTK